METVNKEAMKQYRVVLHGQIATGIGNFCFQYMRGALLCGDISL